MGKYNLIISSKRQLWTEKTSRKEKKTDISIRGPRRMPTKVLRITTRKSPCGNGTNTFDKFEMRIHKRVIDFECSKEELKKMTNIQIPAGIIIEATELDDKNDN